MGFLTGLILGILAGAAGISFNLNGSRCETVGDKYAQGWNACIDAITKKALRSND